MSKSTVPVRFVLERAENIVIFKINHMGSFPNLKQMLSDFSRLKIWQICYGILNFCWDLKKIS